MPLPDAVGIVGDGWSAYLPATGRFRDTHFLVITFDMLIFSLPHVSDISVSRLLLPTRHRMR